jgi:hypothetical protein
MTVPGESGGGALNRSDFQVLAEMRIDDARVLIAQAKWAAAYYLAGYAIECGLKACIIARLRTSDDWPERKFTENCYKHDLVQLLELAGLDRICDDLAKTDAAFDGFWSFAKDWTEQSRYDHATTEAKARALYEAVVEPDHGVLQWIKKHW